MVKVKGIYKYFYGKKKRYTIKACDNITLYIPPGKTLGLVGESGCGKTTLGRIILGLLRPDKGKVIFENIVINSLRERELRSMRKHFQMIFQDSRSAFNPRMRVYEALKEAAVLHLNIKGKAIKEYVNQLIDKVNLHRGLLYNYIGNLSGGEVKRLDILRSIMISPKFIIADEPLSPLDISMQSQVVNLFMEIQQSKKITMMFISHDLRMVRIISHRVAVMYLGKIVEIASKTLIGEKPLHPYTKFLWAPRSTEIVLKFPEKGCVYKGSCELFQKRGFPSICLEKEPELREVEKGHMVACHFVE